MLYLDESNPMHPQIYLTHLRDHSPGNIPCMQTLFVQFSFMVVFNTLSCIYSFVVAILVIFSHYTAEIYYTIPVNVL